jgi:hypothetical protein
MGVKSQKARRIALARAGRTSQLMPMGNTLKRGKIEERRKN